MAARAPRSRSHSPFRGAGGGGDGGAGGGGEGKDEGNELISTLINQSLTPEERQELVEWWQQKQLQKRAHNNQPGLDECAICTETVDEEAVEVCETCGSTLCDECCLNVRKCEDCEAWMCNKFCDINATAFTEHPAWHDTTICSDCRSFCTNSNCAAMAPRSLVHWVFSGKMIQFTGMGTAQSPCMTCGSGHFELTWNHLE